MIKDLTFGGNYRDELFTMEAMLVTPTKHGYTADDVLLFEINITTRGITAKLCDWFFYIMGSHKCIYNAVEITELSTNGLPTMSILVKYQFRSEYLYNDIQLGFMYEPYDRMEFVEINH